MKRGITLLYKIKIYDYEKVYLLKELINIFIKPDEYEIVNDSKEADFVFNEEKTKDKDEIKREIFDKLSKERGKYPPYGILTGIRPVKLFGELYRRFDNLEITKAYLKNNYYVSEEKINLLENIYLKQYNLIGDAKDDSLSVYIGIPFCPSICVYCSFSSSKGEDRILEEYLNALSKEIVATGNFIRESGFYIENLYIGGGTPTSFNVYMLGRLLKTIRDNFYLSRVKEYTVEAGRPDTITREKLELFREFDIDRISINPQSMKEETLRNIGRNHKVSDIYDKFNLAREIGFKNINMDIIAGLPGETLEDFNITIKKILELEPENITVHSLAVKKKAKLSEINPYINHQNKNIVEEMLKSGNAKLEEKGYYPYYLYRQKNMTAALENTGYSKLGKEARYNMRIMDEHQKIVGIGAGSVSKAYYPKENRFERVPNLKNPIEYIKRIDEIVEKKKIKLFELGEKNAD